MQFFSEHFGTDQAQFTIVQLYRHLGGVAFGQALATVGIVNHILDFEAVFPFKQSGHHTDFLGEQNAMNVTNLHIDDGPQWPESSICG